MHGKLFYETPDLPLTSSGSFFGVHFAPILFLLLPFYAIYPSPITLLIMQTIFIALGAIPIYLISDEILKSRVKALAFAFLYLSYPVIQSLNIYDFHLEALLPFFFLSSFYCYLKRRWIPYWIFIILSIITIDFAPIIIGAMSLVNILLNKEEILNLINGKNRKLEKHTIMAILTILVSVISFPLILWVSNIFSGKTSVVTVVFWFLSPQRMGSISEEYMYLLQFWLFMICNLLFLPLFEPLFLLLTAPWFLATILSSGVKTWHLLGYQYGGAFAAAPLFIASIYGAKRLLRENQRNWRLVFTITLSISVLMMPLNSLTENRLVGIAYEGLPRTTPHTATLNQVIHLIPENASVYTINNLFPQLSNRDNAYVYLPDDVNIEYVLADYKSVWNNHGIHGYKMSEILPELMSSGEYGIVAYADGVVLLKRGYVGGTLIYEKTHYIYNHENLALRYGSKIYDSTSKSGTVLVHRSSDLTGTFWFGPYVSLLPGNYTATFRLKADNINTDHLLTLCVSRKLGTIVLASLEVKGSEFESEMSWQSFSLSFSISQEMARGLIGSEKNLEFVGIALSSGSTIYLDYIEVSLDE